MPGVTGRVAVGAGPCHTAEAAGPQHRPRNKTQLWNGRELPRCKAGSVPTKCGRRKHRMEETKNAIILDVVENVRIANNPEITPISGGKYNINCSFDILVPFLTCSNRDTYVCMYLFGVHADLLGNPNLLK